MNEIKNETDSISLSGTATINKEGVVIFKADEAQADQPNLPKKTQRMGRMEYLIDGALTFTPAQMLKHMQMAPMREKIHDNGTLRVEMTSRSFLVHVKVPLTMADLEIEDALDDEMDSAVEVIMKKREELKCSIL